MQTNEALSTEQPPLHAESVLAPLNGQLTSNSDSPVVSTAAESQPSWSSSGVSSDGPSQQSSPSMESSATPPHGNHKQNDMVQSESHSPSRQRSIVAVSPFSKNQVPDSSPASHLKQHEPAQHQSASPHAPGPMHTERSLHRADGHQSAMPSADAALSTKPNGNSSLPANDMHQDLQQAQEAPKETAAAVVPEASSAAPSQTPPHKEATQHQKPTAQTSDRQLASTPGASTSTGADAAQPSSLPSGAYMIPFTATTLSASPQTSPVHAPPMQAAPSLQQAASQPPSRHQGPPPSQQQQGQQHQQQVLHQQQQQVLQQQRFHLMMQAQAAQQQQQQQLQKHTSLQRSQSHQQAQQQQSHMGKAQVQAAFMLQQQGQQQPRQVPAPAAHPRVAQPVWPVPMPRANSGVKRTASGEAAAAAAKKQKTTPLATYQQAQEHLRTHTARFGWQGSEQSKVAEDLLGSIAPRLGPILSVPSTLQTSHAKEIELALRSGVHSSVSWSLNVLTVLSFNAPHHLLLSDQPHLLEALLKVVHTGLEPEHCVVVDCDECLTSAERLLPRTNPQPKPGEPQGWWWEREEGLLAPHLRSGWAFTHACCASNILRNLAMDPRNIHPLMGHKSVETLVQCLAARREVPCPDTNDLALNALDCLYKISGQQGLLLPALPQQLHAALLAELCHAMAAHDTPLRVRMSAPGVLQRLMAATHNNASLVQAADDAELCMLERLSCLLRTDSTLAQQQLQQELAGSCGQADIWAEELPQKGHLAMAITLQAEVLAAAAKAVSELVRHNDQLKQAVAGNSHLMVSLVQLLLSSHMQTLDAWHNSTKSERLKDGLHRHIYNHFKTALQYSTAALINVSNLPAAQQRLRTYEMQLVELAMSDTPQAEWIAALLNKIVPAFD